jgi:V8-like Glu-specific endopeptidase
MARATAPGAGPAVGISPPASVGVVLPGDNRQRVAVSTNPPSRWIGQITSTWPDGTRSVGTATLLDDRHLLTCAHNFYDTSQRVYCRQAVFCPGLNRDGFGNLQQPYGTYSVLRMNIPSLYREQGGAPPPPGGIRASDITKYLYDFAVARLGTAVPDPPGQSMMAPGWPGTTTVNQTICTINGYSGDLDPSACLQYTRSGAVQVSNGEEFVSYRMSTYHGDSGSPVFYQPAGRPYWTIVAVHVTGVPDSAPGANDGLNFGPALNENMLGEIQSMLDAVDR